MIVFVSGGVRSGKSDVAEQAALALHADKLQRKLWYLATARVEEGEMATRVARHQARRDSRWHTLEAPQDLLAAWRQVGAGDTVLLDCLTLWSSQRLFADGLERDARRAAARDAFNQLAALLADARRRDIALVVVSNDLNEELPPKDALVRWYLSELQRLHLLLARCADRVVEVVAGQTLEWKPAGERPADVKAGAGNRLGRGESSE